MKKLIIGLIIFAVVVVGSFSAYYAYNISIYNKAVSLLEQRSFDEAGEVLKKYDKLFEYLKYAYSQSEYEEILAEYPATSFFKDFPSILAYTHIGMILDEDKNVYEIHKLLDVIPDDYSGKFANDISNIRAKNDKEYEEYEAELKKRRAADEAAYKAQMQTRMPYEGMDEKYIDDTLVGKSDKHEVLKDRNGRYNGTKYYWYNNAGKDIVLIITCDDNEVKSISKYYENIYWNSDGTPNFGASKPKYSSKSSTKKSSKTYKDDRYDVYDYSDPEDFYEDNYDDFELYEDAEDYYNDAWD